MSNIYATTLEIGARRQPVYVEAAEMPSGDLVVSYQGNQGYQHVEVTGFQAWTGPLAKAPDGYTVAVVARRS